MVSELTGQADDLGNKEQRKKIRIVGLPQKAEGEDPTQFFRTWLPKIFHIETKSGRVKLKREHCTLAETHQHPETETSAGPHPQVLG